MEGERWFAGFLKEMGMNFIRRKRDKRVGKMVAVGGSFHYNRGEWGRRGRAEGGSRMERDYDCIAGKRS